MKHYEITAAVRAMPEYLRLRDVRNAAHKAMRETPWDDPSYPARRQAYERAQNALADFFEAERAKLGWPGEL